MQEFNVLCVTRLDNTDSDKVRNYQPHLNIQGKLTLEAVSSVKMGVALVKTIAIFTESTGTQHTGEVLWVRSGLDGMSTTIAMRVENRSFPCVEMYTDTPNPELKESRTPEEIGKMAKLTVQGRRAEFYTEAS